MYNTMAKGEKHNNVSSGLQNTRITRYDYNLTIMKSPKPARHYLPTYQILMISDNVEFLPQALVSGIFFYLDTIYILQGM